MKNEKNFTAAITVDQTPEEAFDAMTCHGEGKRILKGQRTSLVGTVIPIIKISITAPMRSPNLHRQRVVWHVRKQQAQFC